MPSCPTALLLSTPLGEYVMAFLLGAIYVLGVLLAYALGLLLALGPWVLLAGLGILLIRRLPKEAAPAIPPQAADTEVAKSFSKKRQAAPPLPFFQRLKADVGVLAAGVTLLVRSILTLCRWLARQWRRCF